MVGCHRCGGRSRAGARYCGACGALLGSARAGARKTVTVLFADAPGLDRHAGDVESGVRAAAALYDCLRQVLEGHGGTVERSAGDAVMAVFGIPSSRDDDARRAAAAALAAQQAVRALPGEPQLSVGLNTGEVLTGDAAADEELAVGDAVVVAARLQQQAAPGEVLLGPATARLLGPEAVLGDARQVSLRGRSGLLRVVPLLGVRATPGTPAGGQFVGRGTERRMLLGVLERTAAARVGSLVTVLGEAGTGKSRLVAEVLQGEPACRVVRSSCRAYGERSTFAPVTALLQALVGLPADVPAARLLDAVRARHRDLVPVLPVLASLLGEGGQPASGPELAWALARLLAAEAGDAPLVLVVEDLHLAEAPLLDVLPDVVRRLEASPLLLVVTARPELLDHRPDWGRGVRHALGVTLRPLAPEHAREVAERLLPGDPDGVTAVVEAAGGNPLFLEQLAKARAEGSREVAPSVAAVLAARLDLLPLEARQVLERAAVVGSAGAAEDLRLPVADEPDPDVERALRVLAQRDLLQVRDTRWVFVSELVREAVEGAMTRPERAELHRLRGLVLAAQGQDGRAGFHLEQAGALLRLADPAQSEVLARQASVRLAGAGARALTGDLASAADLLQRAAALLPADHPTRVLLLSDLARARMLTGDLADAEAVLREAVTAAEELGLPDAAAHARLAQVELLRSTEPERAYAELPELLDQVLPLLHQAGDDRGLSQAYQLQAAAFQYRVRWADMEEPLRRATDHARRAGDRRLVELAESLLVGSHFHGPMPLDETHQRLTAMLAHPATSPSHRASVEARLAGTLALQGDVEAGRVLLAQVRQSFRDLGRELSALATAFIGGPLELLAGAPDRAAADLRAACDGLQAMGDRAFTSTLAALLAEACWRCGDVPGAVAAVELSRRTAGVGDVISQVRWRSVQAKLSAAQGDAGQALRLSADALQRVSTTDEVASQGDVLADAAEVQELLGDLGAAQVLLRDAVGRYQRKGAVQAVRGLSGRLQVPVDPPLALPEQTARVADPATG